MLLLKETIEYRTESEAEAKEMMEMFREKAKTEGYILSSCGYTLKEKKAKGEVVDSGYLLKVVKTHGGFWE